MEEVACSWELAKMSINVEKKKTPSESELSNKGIEW